MRVADKPTKTRVFRAGNSQAVRIPKAFELPEGDVYVERRGGGLFISAMRDRWDLFFGAPNAECPFDATELRDNRPSREVRWVKEEINPTSTSARKRKKA